MVIYYGQNFCHSKDCCPVVEHHPETNTVVIYDPTVPGKGSVTLTVQEYNALLENAPRI